MLGILPSSGPGGMHLKEMLRFQCSQMQFWILKKHWLQLGVSWKLGTPILRSIVKKHRFSYYCFTTAASYIIRIIMVAEKDHLPELPALDGHSDSIGSHLFHA